LTEGGRRFCENCGTEIRQSTNFCPNCGAAQRPDPEVPTGPPPPTPEPGRISTPRASDVPPPPPPPQQPQRSILRTIGGVVVIIVLLIILARLCDGGGGTAGKGGTTTASDSSTQEEAQKKPASKQKEEKAAADPNPNFGDGTHQVGTDIEAGTYRTREGSSGCYYARLSGFQGGMEEIISNDFTNAPSIVTIEPTDAGFQSKNCGTWTKIE
jgi:zinc-ribbon domain